MYISFHRKKFETEFKAFPLLYDYHENNEIPQTIHVQNIDKVLITLDPNLFAPHPHPHRLEIQFVFIKVDYDVKHVCTYVKCIYGQCISTKAIIMNGNKFNFELSDNLSEFRLCLEQ